MEADQPSSRQPEPPLEWAEPGCYVGVLPLSILFEKIEIKLGTLGG